MKHKGHRSGLSHVKKAMDRKELRIGFLGGSITEQSSKHNYSDEFVAMIKDYYKDVELYVQNLGIGATCSTLGCLLAKEQLNKDLDLLIVEYAVNDYTMDSSVRFQAREAILRIARNEIQCDVIIVYTYKEEMFEYYERGELPPSIVDFEILANHYHINSSNMGKAAFDQLQRGLLRYEEWLPDGLHPEYRGSHVYASQLYEDFQSSLLLHENNNVIKAYQENFEYLERIAFADIKKEGPWITKTTFDKWIGDFLYTTSTTASLSFQTKARMVMMGTLFGTTMSDLEVSINGADFQPIMRNQEAWAGEDGWYREDVLYMGEEIDLSIIIRPRKSFGVVGSTTFIAHFYKV